jgi:hypothetical protein
MKLRIPSGRHLANSESAYLTYCAGCEKDDIAIARTTDGTVKQAKIMHMKGHINKYKILCRRTARTQSPRLMRKL